MPRSDSVARRAAASAHVDFYWWTWEDFKTFAGAALEAGPGSIIRAYPGVSEKGHPDVHFAITKPGQRVDATDEDYNFSHVCPPDCPE